LIEDAPTCFNRFNWLHSRNPLPGAPPHTYSYTGVSITLDGFWSPLMSD
jgi:hypothetical protein